MDSTNLPDGQITSVFPKWCQAPFAKIFLFAPDPNQFTDSPVPFRQEGRCATSSTWSGMRWTRAARETSAVCLRTVKSCGSDAPILGVKPVRRSAGDGVKQRGHRGEREVSRKTIARGMPGRSGVTVVTNSYAFLFCMRGFCNGPRRVNPFLRHPLAGHLLLSGIGAGPSPDGVHERNRPANLRKA